MCSADMAGSILMICQQGATRIKLYLYFIITHGTDGKSCCTLLHASV